MRNLKLPLFVLAFAAPSTLFAQVDPEAVDLNDEDVAAEPDTAASEPTAEPGVNPPPASTSFEASASAGTATAPTAEASTTPAALQRPQSPRSRGGPEPESGSWEMSYRGYFRAPMRVGIGSRSNRLCEPGMDNEFNVGNPEEELYDVGACTEDVLDGQSKTTFHAPVIPDDQYLSWQSSPHNKRDWAEMFFSVGNGTVSGNLAIQGFQFADSSWNDPATQFGIGQGWVELNSDLGYENLKFNAKVGSFWTRYGTAGKYDAGEYDTYLFGRTHTVGGDVRLDIGVTPDTTVGIEGGFGTHRPDPSVFNRTRFTLLSHGHAYLNYLDEMEFGAHLLYSWTSSESGLNQEINAVTGNTPVGPLNALNGGPDLLKNGSLTIFGLEGRFDLAQYGYLYAGWSTVVASDAITVAPAVEVIHSFGGGEFNLGVTDNYLETSFCQKQFPIQTGSCSGGNGTVSTFLAQYELSLANFGAFEDDQDLRLKLYGMLNLISSDDQEFLQNDPAYAPLWNIAGDEISQDGVKKLKFGIDGEYFFVPWMSAGVRFDRLQPNSKIPEQSFAILSPRITFRSEMITREQISLQYSRYFYAQRECEFGNPAGNPFDSSHNYAQLNAESLPGRVFCVQPPPSAVTPDGFGAHAANQDPGNRGAPTFRPDVNVIKLEASMWW